MVAIFEKREHNIDFHPMVDFVAASSLRYALTFKPTIYVSHIRQFWSTARIEVTESSLRRNLKLQNEEGISSLPDTELFENLTLMGYNITPNQKFTFQKDEPTSLVRDVNQGEACPTDFGFIADQDMETIAKSSTLPHDSAPRITSPTAEESNMQQSFNELTALCTSLQRQHSELLAKFQAQEVEINRLKERVKILEDKGGVIGDRSSDDAPIKGRRINKEEVATKRVSSDTEEVRLDEGDVAAERAKVPTGSGSIPTAGPPAAKVPIGSDVVPTASPVFATATVVTSYRRRKGKEVLVESETPKKQKLQEQIDALIARELKEPLEREDQRRAEQIPRDAEIARIYAEDELQSMIDGLDNNNETVAKYMEEYCWKVKDFKGMTFKEVEAKFNSVSKQMEYFIPMGLKEEAVRIKRKGINLEQESAKKQKSSEEITKEANSPKEEVHTEGQRAYWKITRLGGSSASYQFFTDLLKHLDRDDLNQLWSLVKETLRKRPATSDKEMELWVELSRLYEPNVEDQLWTHT
nr:hypothetical protein [Tanacetum cinerariifolium]